MDLVAHGEGTGMVQASGYRLEGPLWWIDLTKFIVAPAVHLPSPVQHAVVVPAHAELYEFSPRGVDDLLVLISPPAPYGIVLVQGTGMVVASLDNHWLKIIFFIGLGDLLIVVPPPANYVPTF